MARILSCHGCGVDWQLWLQPLSWELSYAIPVALKKKTRKEKKESAMWWLNKRQSQERRHSFEFET